MLQQWQAIKNKMFNLASPTFKPQISLSRNGRITARATIRYIIVIIIINIIFFILQYAQFYWQGIVQFSTSDMAVDDIQINPGSCNAPPPTPTPTQGPIIPSTNFYFYCFKKSSNLYLQSLH